MAFKIIEAFSIGIPLLGTLVFASLDTRLQKDGKKEVNIHISMGCKESEVVQPNFRPTACINYLRRGSSKNLKNGIYKLYDSTGNSYPAYCDLKSEPGTAWTLVMSWSTSNRRLPAFDTTPFKINAPVNENAQNWDQYRLSLARMTSLQAHSTHWRATCNYPTHAIYFRDYLRGNFKDFDIVDFLGTGTCKKVEYVNIRGHVGTQLTVNFWQKLNTWFLHIDTGGDRCQFTAMKTGAVSSEDNFGHYRSLNSKFRCTQGTQSTTQWWFGSHL